MLNNPAAAVTRPRVLWESQRRTVLHPLEYAALLTAARRDGASSHALVALLGMLGLRISEGSIRYNLRTLYDTRKGKGMLSTHGSAA